MIYRMHANTDKYLRLHIDGKEARRALGEDTDFNIDPSPISYLQHWQTLRVEFFNDSSGSPEIPDIAMRVGKLFLSKKAYQTLQTLIEQYGEFLPVTYEQGEGYIFNCLQLAEKYDAVNKKLSMHDPLNDKYSIIFDEQKLEGIHLFRTEMDLDGFFCSKQIKTTIESGGLTGVEFSADTGHPFPPSADMLQRH